MENKKENIMGTKPVRPLLVGMAVPIMLSMLVQAMYNIVDSIFVAQVSEDALAAVGLAFPIQNLMIAVAVGTAVGVNALLSRRLGEKDYTKAALVTNNGIFLSIITWAVFAVAGFLGSGVFMRSFHQSEYITSAGTQYLEICTVFSLGLFVAITTERILQVTGKTVYQMISQMAGAVVNIILDPILIFGWLGLPKMGVTGAAVATVIGQTCGMIIGLVLNKLYNHEVQITFKGFRPDKYSIKGIYHVGFPSIVMQSIGSVMTYGMNLILADFTATAVAVFGIYFKLQSFVFMPVFGVTNALVPIVGFNYGARRKDRIMQATRVSMVMVCIIMTLGTGVFLLAPDALLSVFNASADMYAIGRVALRVISISFPFAGVAIVLSSLFQAMGEGMLSLRLSVIRQLVVLLPSAWLLARFGGLDAVWYSFLIAEAVSIVVALLSYRYLSNNKLAAMKTENE